MVAIVQCKQCSKHIKRDVPRNSTDVDISQMNFYCSMKCKSTYWKEHGTFKGSNNPNFGATYTHEQRQERSRLSREAYIKDPTLRQRVARNKGKKLPGTSVGIKKFNQEHPGYRKLVAHKWTTEERIECGKKSAAKFTPEYKNRMRTIMEERGEWVPLTQKSDFDIYKHAADWADSMFNKVTDETQLNLLIEHGVFNCRTNTKGVVRDHKYSRRSGFTNKVFPEILRHPCNCEILTHADNVAKKYKRYEDSDSHTLEELFKKIEFYAGTWKEQDLCIDLIKRYRNGERWSNPYKKNDEHSENLPNK